jgi:hypothetical protein
MGVLDTIAKGIDNITGNNNAEFDPIPSFNFVLWVEGVYFLPLKSVHVFTKENEFEYIQEGGVNDYVQMKRKPVSKPFTFQVERYVDTGWSKFLDPLANGTEMMLPMSLFVYKSNAKQGFASEKSAEAWASRFYVFTGCVVTAKEYGELNAEKSGLLVETTTIAYRELMVVNNPIDDSTTDGRWDKFDDDSDFKNSFDPLTWRGKDGRFGKTLEHTDRVKVSKNDINQEFGAQTLNGGEPRVEADGTINVSPYAMPDDFDASKKTISTSQFAPTSPNIVTSKNDVTERKINGEKQSNGKTFEMKGKADTSPVSAHIAVSKQDKETWKVNDQVAQGAFDMKDVDLKKPKPHTKNVATSPVDGSKPVPVKWPPTRRALMADMLSKK